MNQVKKAKTITIFTDAATSPQAGVAVGAFLYFDKTYITEYSIYSIEILSVKLENCIVYEEYESKKSTWSEIKTIIKALEFVSKNLARECKIELYTDCQSICDLLGQRKEKLKKNNFITQTGKILQNATLYQELFDVSEKFSIQTFKIKGHNPKSNPLTLEEKIFSVLDKSSRKKLRSLVKEAQNDQ